MFVVWRGKGIWVPLIAMATLGAALGLEHELGRDFPFSDGGKPELPAIVGGLGLAGIICLLWGLIANRRPPPPMIDRLTGLIVTRRTRHSLYGVPMQYWGAVFIVCAGLLAWWVPA